MVDELDPTIKQLPALMQKWVDEAAENANTSLESLNVVLGDDSNCFRCCISRNCNSRAASDAATGVVGVCFKARNWSWRIFESSKLAEVGSGRLSGATASAQTEYECSRALEELPLLSQDKT